MVDADVVSCCLHALVLSICRRSNCGDGGIGITLQMPRQIYHYTQNNFWTELFYYFWIIFHYSPSVITEQICFWNYLVSARSVSRGLPNPYWNVLGFMFGNFGGGDSAWHGLAQQDAEHSFRQTVMPEAASSIELYLGQLCLLQRVAKPSFRPIRIKGAFSLHCSSFA